MTSPILTEFGIVDVRTVSLLSCTHDVAPAAQPWLGITPPLTFSCARPARRLKCLKRRPRFSPKSKGVPTMCRRATQAWPMSTFCRKRCAATFLCWSRNHPPPGCCLTAAALCRCRLGRKATWPIPNKSASTTPTIRETWYLGFSESRVASVAVCASSAREPFTSELEPRLASLVASLVALQWLMPFLRSLASEWFPSSQPAPVRRGSSGRHLRRFGTASIVCALVIPLLFVVGPLLYILWAYCDCSCPTVSSSHSAQPS